MSGNRAGGLRFADLRVCSYFIICRTGTVAWGKQYFADKESVEGLGGWEDRMNSEVDDDDDEDEDENDGWIVVEKPRKCRWRERRAGSKEVREGHQSESAWLSFAPSADLRFA